MPSLEKATTHPEHFRIILLNEVNLKSYLSCEACLFTEPKYPQELQSDSLYAELSMVALGEFRWAVHSIDSFVGLRPMVINGKDALKSSLA
jgi:hypothetical protein